MSAHSMAELEKQIMEKLTDAMNEASVLMWNDTQTEVSKFYTQGSPKRYKRTHKLESTPDATPVVTSGKEVSFEVYLDKSHGYTTGTFSMADVLTNAENHTAGILGKPQFWKNSEEKMGKTFENTLRKYFH